jgi:hypothetical protein
MKDCFVRKITALCIVALFLLIPASKSFGQDATSAAGAGSKALLFSMAFLTPVAFDNGLGFKYYITDPIALRAGLIFGYTKRTIPAPTNGLEGNQSALRVGGSIGGEYHFIKNRISPFLGGDFRIMSTNTTSNSTTNPQIETKNDAAGETINGTTYDAGVNFRIGAICGAEFFIIPELSIAAEYNLGYSRTTLYDEEVTVKTNPSTSSKTKEGHVSAFDLDAVGGFTVSFYF